MTTMVSTDMIMEMIKDIPMVVDIALTIMNTMTNHKPLTLAPNTPMSKDAYLEAT
jgi:hypothetical protein